MKRIILAINIFAVSVFSTFSTMPATAQNCEVKINSVLIEAVHAEDRLDCYYKTSFGAANCDLYAAHLTTGVNHLEQFFNQSDRVNSDFCTAPEVTTYAITKTCEVKMNGVLIEAVPADDRLDCYYKTSFGSADCEFYAAHLKPGENHLEKIFNQTDRVSSDVCTAPVIAAPATARSCEVKINGVLIEAVPADDRLDCYYKTSFGASNCDVYAAHFKPGINQLEQFFSETDRVNNDLCLVASHETSEGSEIVSLELEDHGTIVPLSVIVAGTDNVPVGVVVNTPSEQSNAAVGTDNVSSGVLVINPPEQSNAVAGTDNASVGAIVNTPSVHTNAVVGNHTDAISLLEQNLANGSNNSEVFIESSIDHPSLSSTYTVQPPTGLGVLYSGGNSDVQAFFLCGTSVALGGIATELNIATTALGALVYISETAAGVDTLESFASVQASSGDGNSLDALSLLEQNLNSGGNNSDVFIEGSIDHPSLSTAHTAQPVTGLGVLFHGNSDEHAELMALLVNGFLTFIPGFGYITTAAGAINCIADLASAE